MKYSIANVWKRNKLTNILESKLLSGESVKEFKADQKQNITTKQIAMRTFFRRFRLDKVEKSDK